MNRKSSLLLALSVALALPITGYSQKPKPKPATPASSQSAGSLVEKLQGIIILQQDEILRAVEARPVEQKLVKDVSTLAVNAETGAILNEKMLDLLSKSGLVFAVKIAPTKEVQSPEVIPDVVIPEGVSDEQKAQITALAKKATALSKQANPAKRIVHGLQTLAEGLLELSKTDKDADSLIKKYNIQKNSPQPAAAADSTTPPNP